MGWWVVLNEMVVVWYLVIGFGFGMGWDGDGMRISCSSVAPSPMDSPAWYDSIAIVA